MPDLSGTFNTKALGFLHGVAFPVWWRSLYASPAAGRALADASARGINMVQLVPTWYQDSPTATTVYADPLRTPSDASLARAVAIAHGLGMRVMLKLHVDVQDSTWRGEIAPTDVDRWFASYTSMVLHYADFAQLHGVESLVLGTELRMLTTPELTTRWRALVAAVRARYGGLLSYAANWDEYQTVGIWDLLDFVGIDAYFPLVDAARMPDPPFDVIVQGWHRYAGRYGLGAWVKELGHFAAATGRPIVFTEIGYRSQQGAADAPWLSDNGFPPNPDLQRRLYDAAYAIFVPRSYFRGLFWWRWELEPGRGDIYGMTPRGKPAEWVIGTWGARLGAGVGTASVGR
jgi:hypothetical protein